MPSPGALATLSPGLGGMEIDSTVFRPATFIELAKANLTRAVLIACVVVVLLVSLFFFNWRAAFISLVTIPLALIAAGLVLHLRGATLNVMVLIGLVVAIGVIVDDAIIHVENIKRRLRDLHAPRSGESPRSPSSVILESLRETRGAMLFAAPICLLAALPVFSLQGIAGNFVQPMAVSYVLAVLASTLVALIITPAMSAILLPGTSEAPPGGSASPLIGWLQAGYERLLRGIISRPRAAYVTAAIFAGVGLAIVPFLRPSLLPTFNERDLLIRLKAAPGIRNADALVGRAVFGDQVVGINSAELCVNIAPTANYGATVTAIQTAIGGYLGIESEVQTFLKRTGSQVVAEAGAPIVVRIYGQDWAILRSKADELRQSFSGIAGIVDSRVILPIDEPTLEVEVDLVAAQRQGINPGTVRRAASTLLNGLQVGSLFQDQKVFDVVVWSTPKTRNSLAAIHNLLIDTPFDVPVRLGDEAQARLVPRPSLIRHEDVSRYVDIELGVDGSSGHAVMGEIQSRLRHFQFPLEYHAEVFGTHEQQQANRNRLMAFAAVALIGILLLLQAAYENWCLAILSILTLPLALVGGLAALATVEAQSLSLGAVLGLLAVFGIAARRTGNAPQGWRVHWRRMAGPCGGIAKSLRDRRSIRQLKGNSKRPRAW